VLALALFLGVLWSITPWLVLTAVLYSAAGSLGTILLGRRLVPLNNRQLQKEADFRFALGRVRERGESGGGVKGRLLDRFNALVENFRAIVSVTRNVGFFTKEYNYLIQILPAVVVAPLYFKGADFGIVSQAAMAFGQVVGAFSLIVTKFQEASTFAAVANRLGAMWEATESAPEQTKELAHSEQAPIEKAADDHRIAYEKLTLWTPQEKRVLIRGLSLEAPEGKRMLVSGPDGDGKTALCLATAGLWGEGEGKVICPGANNIMFLPQRLYTTTGRLRDLLLYGLDAKEVSEEQLHRALEDVGLDRLTREAEGLEGVWDWPNDLTPGDRHALALARLLLAQPRFAFLDGVPWGLGPERLKRLYEGLARTSITYVSVGDAAGLQPYHDLWLELYSDGRWRLRGTDSAEDRDGPAPPRQRREPANENTSPR
jgi:putative ATP-binding cassette transporter